MKLFQKLLLTPAVIGFLSPIAANASEASLKNVSNYSQVDVEVTQDTFKPLTSANPLLAGGEGLNHNQSNDFDGDTFSSTTTASFATNWLVGSVADATDETTKFVWDWELNLSSSFTGNDSLDFTVVSGNNVAPATEFDISSTSGDLIKVDGITYTSKLGDRVTYFLGHAGASGSTLYNSACVYGGQTDVLDDCGIRSTNLDEGLGAAAGISVDLGAGFAAAVGYEGSNGTEGILTKESADAIGAQVSYTGDNYGLAFAVSSIENHTDGSLTPNVAGRDVTTSSAVSAYYVPDIESFPSISVGFESTHDEAAAANADETSNYFVGLQWDELGQGTFGASVGSKTPTSENDDAEKMYEVFYAYNYADGITITPLMFVKEHAASNTNDETGIFLKTSFSF